MEIIIIAAFLGFASFLYAGASGDHIVSGLHVYNNFQVITAEENLRKNCREWPDMP